MEPFKFKLGEKTVEVKESIMDTRKAIINVYDANGKFLGEITDHDTKYRYLAIARAERFDRMMYPGGHHTTIIYRDGRKLVDTCLYISHYRFLDRFIYKFRNDGTNEVFYSLDLGRERYAYIDSKYNKNGLFEQLDKLKNKSHYEDIDINPKYAEEAIKIFEQIDEDFNTKHPKYTPERLKMIMNRKHFDD